MTHVVFYQQGQNWTLLAGPYETEEQALVAMPAAWERMGKDGSLEAAFPHAGRSLSGLMAIPWPTERKGAYGPL